MANPFGDDPIANPLTDTFQSSYGDVVGTGGTGLIGFLSNIFKLITVAGGIFVVINLIIAGFTYIASGSDPKQTVAAWQKIYISLIGLIVMVGAFAIAGIVGYVLFGDPRAILSPTIYGPGADTI